jgi:TRAP-type mannitol/chloroaromatic compound transport system permease small subunit
MRVLLPLSAWIDKANEKFGYASAFLVLFLVFITAADVTLRYLFRAGSVAFQELEWHLYAANFIMAAGWTMLKDGHVRIDILYSGLSPKKKAFIDLLGILLFCIPFCLIVITTSWTFFFNAWVIREGSPDPGGLPARYLLKATIPAGFGLVLFQAFSQLVKAFRVLRCNEDLRV